MTPESIIQLITGTAGAVTVLVIFMALIIADKLHTDAEFNRVMEALKLEKEAHNETRRALAEASGRADAAVKASEIIATAMSTGLEQSRSRREVTASAMDPTAASHTPQGAEG